MEQLEVGKTKQSGSREEYGRQLEQLEGEPRGCEGKIRALVSSLSKSERTAAEEYIMAQIDQLHHKSESLKTHLEELRRLTAGHALSDLEFDIFRDMLRTFQRIIDHMTVEEQWATIRTCARKIV